MNWNAKGLTNVDKERIWKEYVVHEGDQRVIYDTFRPSPRTIPEPVTRVSPRGQRFLQKTPFGIDMMDVDGSGRLQPMVSPRTMERFNQTGSTSAATPTKSSASGASIPPPSPRRYNASMGTQNEAATGSTTFPAIPSSPRAPPPAALSSSQVMLPAAAAPTAVTSDSPNNNNNGGQHSLNSSSYNNTTNGNSNSSTMRFAKASSREIGSGIAALLMASTGGGGGGSPLRSPRQDGTGGGAGGPLPLSPRAHCVPDLNGHVLFNHDHRRTDITKRATQLTLRHGNNGAK